MVLKLMNENKIRMPYEYKTETTHAGASSS